MERIEELAGSDDPLGIRAESRNNPRDGAGDAGRLRTLVPGILEIQVMDDRCDPLEGWIAQAAPCQQDLEGATVATMGELGLEHIEAQFTATPRHRGAGDKAESGLGIDPAADEPGAGEPINADIRPRHPGFPSAGTRPRQISHELGRCGTLGNSLLDLRNRTFCRPAASGLAMIDGHNGLEVSPQLGRLATQGVPVIRSDAVQHRLGFVHQGCVIGVACRTEETAYLVIRHAFDQGRSAHQCLAASTADLLDAPLEVFSCLGRVGKAPAGVADHHRANRLKPSPHSHAQRILLRRKLAEEQEPLYERIRHVMLITSDHVPRVNPRD